MKWKKLLKIIIEVKGVPNIHHLHVWAMSTSQNAMTAHSIIHPDMGIEQLNLIKKNIKHELEHVNIQHATLESETLYRYQYDLICSNDVHQFENKKFKANTSKKIKKTFRDALNNIKFHLNLFNYV